MSSIVPNLRILEVTRRGHVLLVDVYGGWTNVCGSLVLSFTDAFQCRREWIELQGWRVNGMPVTLVRHGTDSFLRRTTLDELDPPAADNDNTRTG